jgi:hypothetical protein
MADGHCRGTYGRPRRWCPWAPGPCCGPRCAFLLADKTMAPRSFIAALVWISALVHQYAEIQACSKARPKQTRQVKVAAAQRSHAERQCRLKGCDDRGFQQAHVMQSVLGQHTTYHRLQARQTLPTPLIRPTPHTHSGRCTAPNAIPPALAAPYRRGAVFLAPGLWIGWLR